MCLAWRCEERTHPRSSGRAQLQGELYTKRGNKGPGGEEVRRGLQQKLEILWFRSYPDAISAKHFSSPNYMESVFLRK